MRLSCAMEKFSFMKESSTTFGSQCKRNMSSMSLKSWKKLNFFRIMWRRVKKKQAKQNEIKSPKFVVISKTEDLEQLLTICYDVIEYLDDCCDDKFQRNRPDSKRNIDEDTFTIWDHMEGAKEKLNEFKFFVDMYGEKSDSEKTKSASEKGILQSVQPASEKQTERTQVIRKTCHGNSVEEPKTVSNGIPEYPINGADYLLFCLNSSTNNESAEIFETDRFNEELVVEISPNNATSKNLSSVQQEHVQIEINDRQFVNYDENTHSMGCHLVSDDKKDFEIYEGDKEQMCHSSLSIHLLSEPFEEIENDCCNCSCHNTENDFSKDSLDLESLHLGTFQALESSEFMSRPWLDEDPSIFLDCSSLKLMAPNIVPPSISKSSSTITIPLTSSSMPCSKTLPLPVGECSNGWEFPEVKCESKNIAENDGTGADDKYSVNVNAHEVFGGFFRHFAEHIFDLIYNLLRKRFL